MEKRNLKNKLLIFLIIVLALILLVNIYSFSKLKDLVEIREINSKVIVSDKIGIDLNESNLNFGAVAPGGSSSRHITLVNNYNFSINAFIYGKGDLEDFVIPLEKSFDAGEEKKIRINVFVPDDKDFGEYNGKVVVKIKKVI
jgi:hypothetical protein